jgi:hypothetical protein
MTSLPAAIASARAVGGRAVHIKIHPRPRTITESREVLRVLERYGEVLMYKSLKVFHCSSVPVSRILDSPVEESNG